MVGEGDRVAIRVRFTGTHTGMFEIEGRTLAPTNSQVDEAEMFICRVSDGKIVESWAVWNRLGVLQQLNAAA
jgi:predicted ester cyclase